MTSSQIQKRLRQFATKEKAALLQRFFKTGPGQYGEGDKFLGVVVPDLRKVMKEFRDAPLAEVTHLLRSEWHEDRMLALLVLVDQFERGDEALRDQIYSLYRKNTRYINNWDLVDLSAPVIVGGFLLERDKDILFKLARSANLWERRIAVMATFCFIRKGIYDCTLAITEMLLSDREDLIHKAAGWMLREIGKRDKACEQDFLKDHYHNMPRTMLRYAIEKFSSHEREDYLKGRI